MSMPMPTNAMKSDCQIDSQGAGLLEQGIALVSVLRKLQKEVSRHVRDEIAPHGVLPDPAHLRRLSASTHPLVWLTTFVEATEAMNSWAKELIEGSRFHETEQLIYAICVAEYNRMAFNGIPVGRLEVVTLADIGLDDGAIQALRERAFALPIVKMTDNLTKERLYNIMQQSMADMTQPMLPIWVMGDAGYVPSLRHYCRKVRSFLHEHVEPYVHAWHMADTPIPLDIISSLAGAGLLDLSDERNGQDRATIAAVVEEIAASSVTLSSYVRHHSLATELVRATGTTEQKERWLARLESGDALCALTFTEMCSGAMADDMRLRAQPEGNFYRISGSKSCVSNIARADLVFVLARTSRNTQEASFFALEKSCATEDDPFPVSGGINGLSGTAVATAGHRGLGLYDVDFDDVRVSADNLIGGTEHLGDCQLNMVQEHDCLNAASQSIGVGRAAVESALRALQEKEIFDKRPEVTSREKNKLALMVAHLMGARQLCRVTAQEHRPECAEPIKSGMAKLLASRVAWLCADTALQIQGGAGIAVENPVSRLWVDARTTSLTECPAEFICRRLLEDDALNDEPA